MIRNHYVRFLASLVVLGLAACGADVAKESGSTGSEGDSPVLESYENSELDEGATGNESNSFEDPRQDPRARTGRSRDGKLEVVWRPETQEVPKNEHFELRLWIFREDELVRDATVRVDAEMPEHGHGMNVQPETVEQLDGSYRVKGMLLHMAGYWLLHVDVVEKGLFERTSFRIDLD